MKNKIFTFNNFLFAVCGLLFLPAVSIAIEIPLDSSVVNAGPSSVRSENTSKSIAYIDIELIFNEHPMTARLKGEFEAQAEKAKKDVADIKYSMRNINTIITSTTTEINSLRYEIEQVKKAIKEKDKPKTMLLPGTTNPVAIAPIVSSSTIGHAINTPQISTTTFMADPSIIDADEKTIKEKEAGIESLKKEYADKQKEIDKRIKSNKGDLTRLEKSNTDTVLKDIYKVLETIAAEENITIVIDKNNVLYGQASQDITEKVRDRLRGR